MTDTLLRQLEDLRDLARTGLKPDIYPTELNWLRGKCDRLAYEADKVIETAKRAEKTGREVTAALKSVEFKGDDDGVPICPSCGSDAGEHWRDCKLLAALDAAEVQGWTGEEQK